MKKTISILVIMTMALSSHGQNLIQENQTWNVVDCINFGGCITQSYKVSGDTIIGQVDYKKLYATYDTAMMSWEIFGALREREDQLFLNHFETMTEEMMYDFNLLPGDTFTTTNYAIGGCPVELLLTSIDTVILENGEARQRFNFGYGGYNEEQWIAGIGSLNGLINVGLYLCYFDLYRELNCCHLDDELIYQSPSYDNCIVYTVGIAEKESGIKHKVYPNPFYQELIVEFDYTPLQSYQIQLFNSYGQVVIDKMDIKSGKVIINGCHLPSGIYFYRLLNEGIVIASGQFVKK